MVQTVIVALEIERLRHHVNAEEQKKHDEVCVTLS